MFQALSQMPVAMGAPLFVGTIIVLSIVCGILFHRFVPHALLIEHNEIAGFVFAVVGVIYAVLLAFLAVGAWEHLQTAEQQTYDEAAQVMKAVANAGIDLDDAFAVLEDEGIQKFTGSWDELTQSVRSELKDKK